MIRLLLAGSTLCKVGGYHCLMESKNYSMKKSDLKGKGWREKKRGARSWKKITSGHVTPIEFFRLGSSDWPETLDQASLKLTETSGTGSKG